MVRECSISGPKDAAHGSAGSVELTREVFNARMRNVAFGSWEELLATLADKPTGYGYRGRHGESESAFKLDPVRIFGWLAVLLINICVWGLVHYFSRQSTLLGLLLTILYGVALWLITDRAVAPRLAGVLWPCVPVTASAVGILLQVFLSSDTGILSGGFRVQAAVSLLLAALPHVGVAAFLLRGVQEDPDRSTLLMNVFAGTFTVILLIYALVTGDRGSGVLYWVGSFTLLFLGLAFSVLGLRLFVNPGELGSMELVSWLLNLGVLAVFISAHLILELPGKYAPWRWLAYALAVAAVALLGAVSGRSFPFLLAAMGLLFLSGRAAAAVAVLAPSGQGAIVIGLVTFGLLGFAIVGGGQWLQQSRWWAKATVSVRCALARAFGSQDLPYSWSNTMQAPLDAEEE